MRRVVIVTSATLLVTAVSTVYLYAVSNGRAPGGPLAYIGFHLGAFAVTGFFSAWVSSELGLRSFLALAPGGRRLWQLLVYGGLGGATIAAANGVLYGSRAAAPLQPPRFLAPHLETAWSAGLLAARAALLEETFFRLLAIPFLAAVSMRLLYGWRPKFPFEARGDGATTRVPAPVIVVAVVLSAVLFGLAHPYSPFPALVFGLLLGWIYLRGGWESAVLAHFLANVVVFTVFYF